MNKEQILENLKYYVQCESEKCGFHLGVSLKMRDLKWALSDLDGAYVSDGKGGNITICPKCKNDSLVLSD